VTKAFKIEASTAGIKTYLKLMINSSTEESIKEAIIKSFQKMYIPEKLSSAEEALDTAKEIIFLILSCNLNEINSISIIITELTKKKMINNVLVLGFFELYYKNEEHCVGAAIIISMLAQSMPEIINVPKILNDILEEKCKSNYKLAKYTLSILEKTRKEDIEKLKEMVIKKLIEKIEDLLIEDYFKIDNWIYFADKSFKVIFLFSKNCIETSHSIISKLYDLSTNKESDEKKYFIILKF
jgi:hypothetical protein